MKVHRGSQPVAQAAAAGVSRPKGEGREVEVDLHRAVRAQPREGGGGGGAAYGVGGHEDPVNLLAADAAAGADHVGGEVGGVRAAPASPAAAGGQRRAQPRAPLAEGVVEVPEDEACPGWFRQ